MPAASGRDSVLRVDRKLFHLGRSGDSFAGVFNSLAVAWVVGIQ